MSTVEHSLDARRKKQAIAYDRILANNAKAPRNHLMRKQVSDQRDWQRVWDEVDTRITLRQTEQLIERAVTETNMIRLSYENVAYGWSGGKDSLALQVVMKAAGVDECVFVITELEYPEFLAWATDNMPDGCEVINTGLDLHWLTRHPDMLFPPDSKASAKWFSLVQHTGQRQFINRHNVECMFLGRRRMDGNLIGANGMTESRRGRFFNPIRDWSHEETLAVIKHHGLEMPPIYEWPRGYQVGTGPWPARQFCRSVEHGWSEVHQIDPVIVHQAANMLPSAREYLERHG